MKRFMDRGVIIGTSVLVLLMIAYGVLAYRTTRRLNEDARWVAHTYEVQGLIANVLLTLVDAETGQRGYLLTGQEEYLAPYNAALARLSDAFKSLKEETRDDAGQPAHVAELEQLAAARVSTLAVGVELRRTGDRDTAREFVLVGTGKDQMDAVRALVGRMTRDEMALLEARRQRSSRSYVSAILSGPSAALFGILLIAAFAYLILRGYRDRIVAAEVIEQQAERLRVTLRSIGDAVIATDLHGRTTYLNPVAEALTGWTQQAASGQPLEVVFRIINELSRESVENPAQRVIRTGNVVGLANHTLLVARDGTERPIDDSAAPIRDARGNITGVVLIFRDVTAPRAEAMVREERERMTAFRADISTALASGSDIEPVLERCCAAAIQYLGLAGAGIWTLDESGKTLQLRASAGLASDLAMPLRQIPVQGSWLGDVIQGGHTLVGGDGAGPFRILGSHAAPDVSPGEWLGVPTVVDSRVAGVFGMSVATALAIERAEELRPLADAIGQFVERRAVEQALAASRERLDFALAVAGMGAWEMDLETGRATWSRTCFDLMGRSPEDGGEASLRAWTEAMHQDDRASVMNTLQVARRERRLFQPEYRIVRADTGAVRWLAGFGRFLYDRAGEATSVSGIFMDITERKHTEERLRELAAVVQYSDDSIATVDLGGVVTSWNSGASRLYGYAAEEMIGRPIMLLTPEGEPLDVPSILARIRRGESIEHYETRRQRKDGEVLDISLTVSPLRTADGDIVGASKIARDITARKQAELALRDAARRKDEFLAILAHELRNPLAPLRNGLEVMRQIGLPDRRLADVRDMLERQVDQFARLVDDLLDVSRINQGKVTLQKSPVELREVIEHAWEISRPLFEVKHHELVQSVPAKPLTLDADPVRLTQVIANLLNNAAKYTPDHGIITLSAARAGEQAVITVRDNGIGIDRGMLAGVFDLLAQSPDGAAQDGLGVGLALVRGLVASHGGTVSVASKGRGRGSEFTVRLPLWHGERPAAASAPKPERSESDGSPLRILVVDDNRDSAGSITLLLQLAGHEVRQLHDGKEALAQAAQFRPDVALLDIGLPGMDGNQLAVRIRALAGLEHVVLVAMTGYGQDEDRRRTREAGFTAHMVKPVDIDALQRLLDGVPRPSGS